MSPMHALPPDLVEVLLIRMWEDARSKCGTKQIPERGIAHRVPCVLFEHHESGSRAPSRNVSPYECPTAPPYKHCTHILGATAETALSYDTSSRCLTPVSSGGGRPPADVQPGVITVSMAIWVLQIGQEGQPYMSGHKPKKGLCSVSPGNHLSRRVWPRGGIRITHESLRQVYTSASTRTPTPVGEENVSRMLCERLMLRPATTDRRRN